MFPYDDPNVIEGRSGGCRTLAEEGCICLRIVGDQARDVLDRG